MINNVFAPIIVAFLGAMFCWTLALILRKIKGSK